MENNDNWINVKDETPAFIKGKDYSENVLAWCNGQLMVMCYTTLCDSGANYKIWANCYGDIFSLSAEYDDEYNVTHWMLLPKKPKKQPNK